MGVNNLSKVVTQQRDGRGSNSRPLSHQSDALATRLSSHDTCTTLWNIKAYKQWQSATSIVINDKSKDSVPTYFRWVGCLIMTL